MTRNQVISVTILFISLVCLALMPPATLSEEGSLVGQKEASVDQKDE